MAEIKDFTGQRFGKIVVLGIDPVRHRTSGGISQVRWLCKCDCGKEFSVLSVRFRAKKPIQSCGCLKPKRKLKDGKEVALRRRYEKFAHNALVRNFKPPTEELFFKLAKEPCFYCGKIDTFHPYQNKSGQTNKKASSGRAKQVKAEINGLDRVDNSKGYEEDNVVSCCADCNMMKSTLSQEVFLDKIDKIAKKYGFD